MIGVAIAFCASLFAASAFVLVVRHSQILVTIGLRTILAMSVLLLPAAPFVILVGAGNWCYTVGDLGICLLFAEFFHCHEALEAMSRLMGAEIAMLSFVAVSSHFHGSG